MPKPKPNRKAARLIRAINKLTSASLELVASQVENPNPTMILGGVVGLIDEIQGVIKAAQALER